MIEYQDRIETTFVPSFSSDRQQFISELPRSIVSLAQGGQSEVIEILEDTNPGGEPSQKDPDKEPKAEQNNKPTLEELVDSGIVPGSVHQVVQGETDEDKKNTMVQSLQNMAAVLEEEGIIDVDEKVIASMLTLIQGDANQPADLHKAYLLAANHQRFDIADFRTIPYELYTDPGSRDFPVKVFSSADSSKKLLNAAQALRTRYGINKSADKAFTPSVDDWLTKDSVSLVDHYADTVEASMQYRDKMLEGREVEITTPSVSSSVVTRIDFGEELVREGFVAETFRKNERGELISNNHISFRVEKNTEGNPKLVIGEIQSQYKPNSIQQDGIKKVKRFVQGNSEAKSGSEHLEVTIAAVVEASLATGAIKLDTPVQFTEPDKLFWLDHERSRERTDKILRRLKNERIFETTDLDRIQMTEANVRKFAEYSGVNNAELEQILDKATVYLRRKGVHSYHNKMRMAFDMLGTRTPEYRNKVAAEYPGYSKGVFPGLADYHNPPTAEALLHNLHEKIIQTEHGRIRNQTANPQEAQEKIEAFETWYRNEHHLQKIFAHRTD